MSETNWIGKQAHDDDLKFRGGEDACRRLAVVYDASRSPHVTIWRLDEVYARAYSALKYYEGSKANFGGTPCSMS